MNKAHKNTTYFALGRISQHILIYAFKKGSLFFVRRIQNNSFAADYPLSKLSVFQYSLVTDILRFTPFCHRFVPVKGRIKDPTQVSLKTEMYIKFL